LALAVSAIAFGGAASASAATTVNLVTADTGTSNGAIYNWVDQQTTGTGVIEPFLRVQNNGTEQGYNESCCSTGNNPAPWDTKTGSWTHDLLLSQLVTKTINNVAYYEFLLDINQNTGGNNNLLSLNNVQIFTRAGAITTAPENLLGLGTLRYNNDVGAQGDTTVELDYDRNPGSGAGDMFMYVPVSAFAGASQTDNVYFYSAFGSPNGSNDGFEEWALVGTPAPTTTTNTTTTTPSTVPEPGLLALLGAGLGMTAQRLRRRRTA
jgi:hypothetical protein